MNFKFNWGWAGFYAMVLTRPPEHYAHFAPSWGLGVRVVLHSAIGLQIRWDLGRRNGCVDVGYQRSGLQA